MQTRISPQRQRQLERAYEVRNLQGFEGDTYMRDKFKQIIADYKINLVIELGTYLGGTTRQLAGIVDEVITIEINKAHFNKASPIIKGLNNVTMFHDSSVSILPFILNNHQDRNILLFIDSHWQEHNPLLEELEIIARSGLKPVLAIHDFKVPNRHDLGFDTYGDIIYEWDWIKSSIENIYGADGYVKEYNDRATGAKRGILYLYPKV